LPEQVFLQFLLSLLITIAFPLGTLGTCMLLEQIGPRETIGWHHRLPGLLMNAVGTSLSILLVWPLGLAWQELGVGSLITVPLGQWLAPLGAVGVAVQFLLLVMLADFLAYWRHRTEHRILWRIHSVHHSPRHLHAANDIAHPLQVFYSIIFVTLPLSLIQFDGPAVPIAVGFVVGLLSMYIHSPVKLHAGPLRKFVVDNRFHRIHHSLEPRHYDKNFSICFSCWDYLFGTAYEPGDEWPAVGLADVPPPATIRDFLWLPFRKASAGQPAE